MTKQHDNLQGLYVGHTRPKASPSIARTVLAHQLLELPASLPTERAPRKGIDHETQKVLYIACVSFFVLFACTLFDFIAFRS